MTPAMIDAAKSTARNASDVALVKRCLDGQEEAWNELIDKYKALIYSVPVKYGLQPQEAADVFQGTCVELLTRLKELREPQALPKWLIQVAYHRCYHLKRQQNRFLSRDSEVDLPDPAVPAVADSFLRQTEDEQMLREAMAALEPRCKKLVEMLFFETPARPYTEVAKELNLAVGSIGLTRQKCMERLRRQLDAMGF
jgi:RNA polymerase sigma factor (sigma-70 family)